MRWYAATKSTILVPGDSRRKSMIEWHGMVGAIFSDVVAQMRRAEQIDTATEHRLLAQRNLLPVGEDEG